MVKWEGLRLAESTRPIKACNAFKGHVRVAHRSIPDCFTGNRFALNKDKLSRIWLCNGYDFLISSCFKRLNEMVVPR